MDNKIKWIISDLDGTLLMSKEQSLRPEVLELVGGLLDAGYKFVAASGRQYPNLRRLFGKYADRLSYICENGSLVIHKGQVAYKGILEESVQTELLEAIMEHETFEALLSGMMQSYIKPKSDYYYDLVANRVKNNVKVVKDFGDVTEECLKISIYERRKITDQEEKDWIGRYSDRLTVVRSSEKWLDFMPPGTNKGNGLQILMKAEGICPEECMVFGDQDNDLEMIQCGGYSYAMREGSQTLQKAAKHVIVHPKEVLQHLLDGTFEFTYE